jgi:hypothetical protein
VKNPNYRNAITVHIEKDVVSKKINGNIKLLMTYFKIVIEMSFGIKRTNPFYIAFSSDATQKFLHPLAASRHVEPCRQAGLRTSSKLPNLTRNIPNCETARVKSR